MIPPKNRPGLCYCSCCCLSDDPGDSEMHPLDYDPSGEPYNRRTDCSCKERWPYCLGANAYGSYGEAAKTYAMMIAMRARDCGAENTAQAAMDTFEALRRIAIVLGAESP